MEAGDTRVFRNEAWERRDRTPITPDTVEVPNLPRTVAAVKTPASPTSSVTVTWQAPLVDATHDPQDGYQVFLNAAQRGGDLAANATSLVVPNLTPGATYATTMQAFNTAGQSGATAAVNVTLDSGQVGGVLFLGHKPGKIYLGWSTDWTDTEASNQLNTYTPNADPTYSARLGVRRLYSKNSTVINYADAQQRVLWISAKGPDLGASSGVAGWQQVANGTEDAGIVSYFNSLVSRNKLTVFSFHHEPIGDQTATSDGTIYANACRRIRQVVDSNFGSHRILFCFNYEENRLRNLNAGGAPVNWALWIPEDWQDIWHFPSFDFYQYGEDTSANPRLGVEMSHRWWRVDELFTGDFRPAGTTVMPWMTYTPGVDFTYGIGETSARPGAFYNWQNGLSTSAEQSNMTGAKWARDQWDYIFSDINKFWMVSTFNSLGASHIYNDERLVPDSTRATSPSHTSFVVQTGDTERTIDIYREKLDSGLTVKLAANGLPPA